MEHELGETFTWNGHALEVVEVKDPEDPCSGCYFFRARHKLLRERT